MARVSTPTTRPARRASSTQARAREDSGFGTRWTWTKRRCRRSPPTETKPVDLASIYALTKYVQERAVLIFGEAYGVEAVALRLFNVFGPGQALSNPYTGVLANFSSRLRQRAAADDLRGRAAEARLRACRDVARAFRLALEEPRAAGEVINMGSGRPTRSPTSPAAWRASWAARTSRRRSSARRARATSATASPISPRRAGCSGSSRGTS